MRSEPEDPSVDVLVFAGAGIGHYLPIAGLLSELTEPCRVAVCAQVAEDHPLAAMVRNDGHTFVPWPAEPPPTVGGRIPQLARRTLSRRVVPRLAIRGRPDAPLPSVACRTAFALSSVLRPWSDVGADRARSIDSLLARFTPSLVLTEGNEDWVERCAATRSLDWALYTTGPVSTVVRGRPVGPAGFPPTMSAGTQFANSVVRVAKQLRRRATRHRLEHVAQSLGHTDRRRPTAAFACSVEELDAYAGLAAHGFEYAGLFPYRPPSWWAPAMLDDVDAPARRTVVVSWGSGEHEGDASFFDRLLPVLIELAEDRDVVVVSSQPAVSRAVTAAGCDSMSVIERSDGPPYELFRRAAVVITHGGYGTIKDAVAMGAAVLVAPEIVADRMETAQRVLVSGVGRSVNRSTVDTPMLRSTLHEVLNDVHIRRSVAVVGAALRDGSRHEDLTGRLRAALTRTG